ncbi:MAG TPA: hypothetical protein VG014_05265 [Acidimicrobiales bacterium]|jgi:hypothetical protein|nr:hypothetical protein [Acidimicrobiales bacterium]
MSNAYFRTTARLVAWGRVGVGTAAVLTPSLVARPWVGDVGDDVPARLLARAMGGRDLVLGIGTLRGLSVSDAEGRPWVALSGVADLVDAVATVVAFGHLPRRARWAYLAIALGAAVTSTRAAIALDSSAEAPVLPT